ncbi:MAG: cupredoxin domain-containing protein [Aliiglaciecola sp.]|uniref:cupredoxin domain-containing protein n=1 Tax=Aliiglaciecola sp. TaxID=1872441 RepID=UPI000E9D837F|nr:copper-transporting ATPase [Balneolaceae bacterium]
MTLDEIFVLIGGILLIALVAWYFWFSSSEGTRIQSSAGGLQEALIKVKGGYSPNVIVVEAGKPVRLNFLREETAACSEQVIFPDFGKQATLTPHKTIPVEFIPDTPGEYEFQCAMGMLRGKLIVE